MPVRKRIGAVASREVDPDVFSYGDGTWSFFEPYEPVYPNREAALRAWGQVRRWV
jgi:hypothetical protein